MSAKEEEEEAQEMEPKDAEDKDAAGAGAEDKEPEDKEAKDVSAPALAAGTEKAGEVECTPRKGAEPKSEQAETPLQSPPAQLKALFAKEEASSLQAVWAGIEGFLKELPAEVLDEASALQRVQDFHKALDTLPDCVQAELEAERQTKQLLACIEAVGHVPCQECS